jgi:hypothetical protein
VHAVLALIARLLLVVEEKAGVLVVATRGDAARNTGHQQPGSCITAWQLRYQQGVAQLRVVGTHVAAIHAVATDMMHAVEREAGCSS